MEKSTIKLVLTQEVVEKLCEQNPEFRIELEQMALKWVKQSVIKPLVAGSTKAVTELVKSHAKGLINDALHKNIFENVVSSRYSLEESDRLVKATSDLVLKEIQPDKVKSEFWAEVLSKRDAKLAAFNETLDRYLSPKYVEGVIISEVRKYMTEICANLSRVTDSADREGAT